MHSYFLLVLLAAAAGLATLMPQAQAQPPRAIYELAGAVAVSVLANDIGDERSNRACDTDSPDAERRVQFILNETRLVLLGPIGIQAVERHLEYHRLVARRDAMVRALPQSVTSSVDLHMRALDEADRPLEPWRNPLWLRVDVRSLAVGPASCGQSATLTVSGRIMTTRMISSGSLTNTSPIIFSRSTLLLGPTAGACEQRGRVVEEFARDFANAWAEANR